jgi:hypothetical protein
LRQRPKEKSLKNNLSLCIVFALVACCVCSPAYARDNRNPFQSEEAFLAQMGEWAASVAPGVYRIQVSPLETIEVAFGQQGLDYDRARVQEELTALKAQLSQNPSDPKVRRELRQRIAERTSALAALWEGDRPSHRAGQGINSISGKAAVTGTVCGNFFNFSLDGGFTSAYMGGSAWGQASISVDPEALLIGPPAEIPAHRAYSAVNTMDDSNNTYSSVDTQLVPQGSAATAQSSASVWCGLVFECPAWISYNWVNAYGCTDGYRRIYRTKVNPDATN